MAGTDADWVATPGHESISAGFGRPSYVSLGGGRWIPTSFDTRLVRASEDDDALWGNLVVSLFLRYDLARTPPAHLVSVEIHRGGRVETQVYDPVEPPPRAPERAKRSPLLPITSADLKLPLQKLIRLAIDINTVSGPSLPAGEALPEILRRELRCQDGSPVRDRFDLQGRRVLDAPHLAEVARIYVDALTSGEPTTEAVAEAFSLSTKSARKRISQSRSAGMLTETAERRKGGELTDLARAVLARAPKETT